MKEFDFNKLTEAQIVSKGMDRALIADNELFFENAFNAAGFDEIRDGDYDVARTAAQAVLESVNKALKAHNLEIRTADMADYMSWILVPKGITEKKFGEQLVA